MDDEFPICAAADARNSTGPGCLGLLLVVVALAVLAWLVPRWI